MLSEIRPAKNSSPAAKTICHTPPAPILVRSQAGPGGTVAATVSGPSTPALARDAPRAETSAETAGGHSEGTTTGERYSEIALS